MTGTWGTLILLLGAMSGSPDEDLIDRFFKIFDHDGDGVITTKELASEKAFGHADRDRDGRVTREELARFLRVEEPTPKRESRDKFHTEVVRKLESSVGGADEKNVFFRWYVERLTERMRDRSLPARTRLESMRNLHAIVGNEGVLEDASLGPLVDKVWQASVRTLSPPTPPELSIEMLRFFRERLPDERRLLRVLVHFVYPRGAYRGITEAVRREATLTIQELGGIASLPTLLYTLADDSDSVTRAVDEALCALLQNRDMAASGAGPFTEEERDALRRSWRAWTHTPEATKALIAAVRSLHEMTAEHARRDRRQQSNPIAEHVIFVILLDDEVEWEAWRAGYVFLKKFLGRDFAPKALRGVALEEKQRPVLRERISAYVKGGAK